MSEKQGFLESRFQLKANGTTVRNEVVGGITTFLTMAYIIFVNPGIVSGGIPEMPFEAVMIATVASAILATMIMALYANYPFALAPGMGLNAYFTYSVVLGMGYTWQTALGAVFVSGVALIILTLTPVREMIIGSVPADLKSAIAAGIGLFLAFIGLKNGGIIVSDPVTFLALGDLTEPGTLLAAIGVIITGGLMAMRVRGAILIGIVLTAVVGFLMGIVGTPDGFFKVPSFSQWAPIFGQLDLRGMLSIGLLEIIFAFLFVDLFDTVGTLIGVSDQGGFLDEKGRLPRAKQALMADAIGTVGGSVFGTPTVTTYVESAAGVGAGGRTGLVGVVVSICFALSLFFTPVVETIASAGTEAAESPVTAAALIIVGAMMMRAARNINWDNMTVAIPAFIAIAAMPFTFSIATGISLAFILFPFFALCSGKGKEVHWIMYVLGILFVLRFIFLSA